MSQGRPSVQGKIAGKAARLIYKLLETSNLQKEVTKNIRITSNDLLTRPMISVTCMYAVNALEHLLDNQRADSDLDELTAACVQINRELQYLEEELV